MFEITLGEKVVPTGYLINSRTAVRGVIANDSGYLLIQTNKGDYKFPGGGIVIEQNLDQYCESSFFVMKSIYIECKIDHSQQQNQTLDHYEHEQDFTPVLIPIETAIENNLKLLAANPKDINRWVRRDTEVMMIIANLPPHVI